MASWDTSNVDTRTVWYRFTDKEIRKVFKAQMKVKGFKFDRSDSKEVRGNEFIHNIYVSNEYEIDLFSERLAGKKIKYALVLRVK